jgi:hypothetical protein
MRLVDWTKGQVKKTIILASVNMSYGWERGQTEDGKYFYHFEDDYAQNIILHFYGLYGMYYQAHFGF